MVDWPHCLGEPPESWLEFSERVLGYDYIRNDLADSLLIDLVSMLVIDRDRRQRDSEFVLQEVRARVLAETELAQMKEELRLTADDLNKANLMVDEFIVETEAGPEEPTNCWGTSTWSAPDDYKLTVTNNPGNTTSYVRAVYPEVEELQKLKDAAKIVALTLLGEDCVRAFDAAERFNSFVLLFGRRGVAILARWRGQR
jgi:hypothetical protein